MGYWSAVDSSVFLASAGIFNSSDRRSNMSGWTHTAVALGTKAVRPLLKDTVRDRSSGPEKVDEDKC